MVPRLPVTFSSFIWHKTGRFVSTCNNGGAQNVAKCLSSRLPSNRQGLLSQRARPRGWLGWRWGTRPDVKGSLLRVVRVPSWDRHYHGPLLRAPRGLFSFLLKPNSPSCELEISKCQSTASIVLCGAGEAGQRAQLRPLSVELSIRHWKRCFIIIICMLFCFHPPQRVGSVPKVLDDCFLLLKSDSLFQKDTRQLSVILWGFQLADFWVDSFSMSWFWWLSHRMWP